MLGDIQIWKSSAGFDSLIPHLLLSEHDDIVTCIDMNVNNSNILASSSNDCTVKLWDVENEVSLVTLDGHFDAVNSVSLSNNFISSTSNDSHFRVWDTRDNKNKLVFDIQGSHALLSHCWLEDGSDKVLIGSENGLIELCDLRKGIVQSNKDHNGCINSIVINKEDNKSFITASNDKAITVKDVESLNSM